MSAWTVSNFGGQIPLQDTRLLPDNQAEAAWNVDLNLGRLQGLAAPTMVKDLTAAPDPVMQAYRFPGPTTADPDVWLPLPSPFSCVVRSPLANDTLHRIYWTNPGGGSSSFWNTYARIAAGQPPYTLGFLPVEPSWVPVATASGGSLPLLASNGASVSSAGTGYVPGEALRVVGGVLAPGQPAEEFTVFATQAVTIAIIAGGSGGTDGSATLIGTTGTGSRFFLTGTVAGGVLTTINSVGSRGAYDSNPVNINNEPLVASDNTLVGAAVAVTMGVLAIVGRVEGWYISVPANPAVTTSSSGTGCTLNVLYATLPVPPLVARSYLFTYVDQYGQESSPSVPSAVVEGASDGLWTVFGLSNTPPTTPPGALYPTVTKIRIYRTVTGTATGGQFFQVAEIAIPPGINPAVGWVDTVLDLNIVNNNVLGSTSWASPPAGLDGLVSLPGGILVGFTENTLHFCEPDRPHAWPASYDLSVNYQIVGLAVWQASLVVLTKGFPSTGSGSSPANFALQQLQVAEPCIARGSLLSDLLGVYYASPNGLVMLNYYGLVNQSQKLVTRGQWTTDYHGDQLIACRHKAQYLALNAVGTGIMIDFADPRAGLVQLNTFSSAVSMWNDVYSGDAYIMAGKKVYRWDDPVAVPTVWRWRSKRWSLAVPISLAACQVTLTPELLTAVATTTPLFNADPLLVLPAGVNALFRLYADDARLIIEKNLTDVRSIFTIPSGFKAFDWQFEIVSRVPVLKVELATSMRELKGV